MAQGASLAVPAIVARGRTTREERAEVAQVVELLRQGEDDGEGGAQRSPAQTVAEVANPEVLRDAIRLDPSDHHAEGGVVVVKEEVLIDLHDGAQLAEAGLDPYQVSVLDRKVHYRNSDELGLLEDEMVGCLLRALQCQPGTVVDDRAEARHGIAIRLGVKAEEHVPPRGRDQPVVDGRGNREEDGVDVGARVVHGAIKVDEGESCPPRQLHVRHGHPQELVIPPAGVSSKTARKEPSESTSSSESVASSLKGSSKSAYSSPLTSPPIAEGRGDGMAHLGRHGWGTTVCWRAVEVSHESGMGGRVRAVNLQETSGA